MRTRHLEVVLWKLNFSSIGEKVGVPGGGIANVGVDAIEEVGVGGGELGQRGDDEMSVTELCTAAAAADTAPRSHKLCCVGVNEEDVTCVYLHHHLEVAEIPISKCL
jgi:hypothetical protein